VKVRSQRRPQLAAGCVVWRERGGRLEVLLVHRPRYKDWSWPKGKVEPGEHPVVAACRETAEETGRHVVLGSPLPTVSYRIGHRRRKQVYYWSARLAVDDDAPSLRARQRVTVADRAEIDQARWYEAGRARRRLTRRSDRAPLDALVARWRDGTLVTRAVIVLRHAVAVPRERWEGDEASRPLTRSGLVRAERTVGLLAAFGVRQIWTSPWRRCRQTVGPYARATRLKRVNAPAVTETAAEADPAAASRLMDTALAAEQAVVICSHRPVLGTLLDAIVQAIRPFSRLRRDVPRNDPYLRTAELLVAHVTAANPREVAAIERHRP
jgi:8-oxo-dGTP diphosphatase